MLAARAAARTWRGPFPWVFLKVGGLGFARITTRWIIAMEPSGAGPGGGGVEGLPGTGVPPEGGGGGFGGGGPVQEGMGGSKGMGRGAGGWCVGGEGVYAESDGEEAEGELQEDEEEQYDAEAAEDGLARVEAPGARAGGEDEGDDKSGHGDMKQEED